MHGLTLHSLTSELFTGVSLQEAFAGDPRYSLIKKIKRSMGEIGAKGTWGEAVDAYQKMSRFSLGDNPDFELRLDHIIDTDGWGKTRHAKICVDGVFAYFLYHKKVHILTVAFSIMSGKRLLIGQMQAPPKSKGWGLQFLPRGRLEFVIDCFIKAFPDYRPYLVYGEEMVSRVLNDYRSELKKARLKCKRYRAEIRRKKNADGKVLEDLRDEKEFCKTLRHDIKHLTKEKPRLVSTYRKTGRFKLVPHHRPLNGLMHHMIVF